ncbi:MAG: hypothetical protein KGS10_19070 [Chloroflexi bacterium]|nr:hypothetical protein [Chloroflexota bacterium]
MKRWQKVSALAQAVRMVEKRIERAEEDGRERPLILVRLAERMHKQLANERLAWEGVTDVGT